MHNPQRRKINVGLMLPFLIIAVVFGAMVWSKIRESREVRPVPQVVEPAAVRKAVLFFVSGSGSSLEREARETESCGDTPECVTALLEELLNGPVGDLGEALPESTLLRSVRIDGATAVVDLNQSFISDLPAGSSAEMLAVYSIVNTVCVNFPRIVNVRLTIEGNEKAVLKHLDLSEPLAPDVSLEAAAAPSGAGTAAVPNTTTGKKGQP